MTNDQFLKAREIQLKIREHGYVISSIDDEWNVQKIPKEMFEAHKADKKEFFMNEIARLEAEFAAL